MKTLKFTILQDPTVDHVLQAAATERLMMLCTLHVIVVSVCLIGCANAFLIYQ
jgi:hypothetical protein